MENPRYTFSYLTHCLMCGEKADRHKILGQRLNGSQGFRPRAKKGITTTIMKCTNCRLVYSNPQPVPYTIHDHYSIPPESYWKSDYFRADPTYFSNGIARLRQLMPFHEGMKALDIGAGLGKCMLALEAAGFEAYGIEASKSFYEKAIKEMNIKADKLKFAMIEDIDYDENVFDFINFGAVLEHLYNPSACIEKALRWLKPGGLMQIEVPSADYLIARLINLYYTLIGTSYVTNTSPMHSPYHLFEFTLTSFEKLAESKRNFEVVFSERFVCSAAPFPKFMQKMLLKTMKVSRTGMQLSVWLKKK
jgi:SAM-dependent methyltransferase